MFVVGQYGLLSQLFILIGSSLPRSFVRIFLKQSAIVLSQTVTIENNCLLLEGLEIRQGSSSAWGTTQIGAIGMSYDSKWKFLRSITYCSSCSLSASAFCSSPVLNSRTNRIPLRPMTQSILPSTRGIVYSKATNPSSPV